MDSSTFTWDVTSLPTWALLTWTAVAVAAASCGFVLSSTHLSWRAASGMRNSTAGGHARDMARHAAAPLYAWRRRSAVVFLAVLAVACALALWGPWPVTSTEASTRLLLTVAFLLAASIVGMVLQRRSRWTPKAVRTVERSAAGARSESRVAAVLEQMGAGAVRHGLLLGAGGDVDHVVIGPVLVAVETKTGRGAVRRDGTALHAGRRRIPGDPIAQVSRQADRISRLTGAVCAAVVCIPDADLPRPVQIDGVWVCSLASLPACVHQQSRVLTGDAVTRVVTRLDAVDRDERARRAR